MTKAITNYFKNAKSIFFFLLLLFCNLCYAQQPGSVDTMTYAGCELIKTTTPVGIGEGNERIIGVNIKTQGSVDPLVLNGFEFNLTGTSNIYDVIGVGAFYGGTKKKLNLTNQFGNVISDIDNVRMQSIDNTYLNANPVFKYDNWSENWKHINFFEINGNTFLFRYRNDVGSVMVNQINVNGKIGSTIHSETGWSLYWSHNSFFKKNGQVFLFRYRNDVGSVMINQMNLNGSIGATVYSVTGWSFYWSHINFFEKNGNTFLFRYRNDVGSVMINQMNSNGSIGTTVHSETGWSLYWSHINFFEKNGSTFLFRYRKDVGSVMIKQMNSNGSIGSTVHSETGWSNYWSHFNFFEKSGNMFLFRYRNDVGGVLINQMNTSGSIGSNVYTGNNWALNWSIFNFPKINGLPFFFRYRKNPFLPGSQTLSSGDNFFWLTANLKGNAKEGNILAGNIESIIINGSSYSVASNTDSNQRIIVLEHTRVFQGGQYSSNFYRIPAIITAQDGSLIVASDARIIKQEDISDAAINNIDIKIRRSLNMGESWTSPVTVADFGNQAASDPSLVVDASTGDILCLFASHNGINSSTFADRIRFQVSRSTDNGITWSSPINFTNQMYASNWYGAWVASGRAHQMRNGRILAVVAARLSSGTSKTNFLIYSDDGGTSWDYLPDAAANNGNEAKVVELDNGDLLMSIRNTGYRRFVISNAQCNSWCAPFLNTNIPDPAVNGDIIRYTSVLDGYNKSRLLMSLASHAPAATQHEERRNLTIFLSYNEGSDWEVSKVLNPGPVHYSSLTILSDGTIGCVYENSEFWEEVPEEMEICFARFSLKWLTDGLDSLLSYSPKAIANSEILNALVFPNPIEDDLINVNFELDKSSYVEILLYDYMGRQIEILMNKTELKEGYNSLSLRTNVSNHSFGLYFLKINTNGKSVTRKIILQ